MGSEMQASGKLRQLPFYIQRGTLDPAGLEFRVLGLEVAACKVALPGSTFAKAFTELGQKRHRQAEENAREAEDDWSSE
jgi:hypothetical protein